MSDKVMINNKLSDAVEEAVRTLRTNIQFCNTDKAVKTICLTSCIPIQHIFL